MFKGEYRRDAEIGLVFDASTLDNTFFRFRRRPDLDLGKPFFQDLANHRNAAWLSRKADEVHSRNLASRDQSLKVSCQFFQPGPQVGIQLIAAGYDMLMREGLLLRAGTGPQAQYQFGKQFWFRRQV